VPGRIASHEPLLPPLLDWVFEPVETDDVPLLAELLEVAALAAGLVAALAVGLVAALLLLVDPPEPLVLVEVLAVPELVESLLAASVALAACSTNSPKPAALAATTPVTASLIRVASFALPRGLLFMVQPCDCPLWGGFESTVRKL
jgi:hypothetical protein